MCLQGKHTGGVAGLNARPLPKDFADLPPHLVFPHLPGVCPCLGACSCLRERLLEMDLFVGALLAAA